MQITLTGISSYGWYVIRVSAVNSVGAGKITSILLHIPPGWLVRIRPDAPKALESSTSFRSPYLGMRLLDMGVEAKHSRPKLDASLLPPIVFLHERLNLLQIEVRYSRLLQMTA
ncbi:unnamed protein product [Protopolystoma xenopodis]|uniref:Fibronectin type-III domain-containing protein n=1 Tax=Protopolystoma xenopodis TaxID=117903 RepID=A0A448XAK0_9PLAT|nr:unnamed protein product [Protopolystoma xenopodis]